MKKSSKTEPENDDFRRILREEMLAYFAGDGKDELKTTIRGNVRDELYGDDKTGNYSGDSSAATRVEIRKLVREELFPEEKT
jgi:hypothetical protein